jgi:hypothetical protein
LQASHPVADAEKLCASCRSRAVKPNITAQSSAPPASGVRRREVFISYSHLDATAFAMGDLPKRFHDELLQLASNWPDFGITAESIFFDRRGLRAGDDWEMLIEDALARCEIFIFLASPNALASAFCVKRELGTALATGKRIVPVLLADCQWFDHRIEGDASGRRLGRFDAVPKDERTQPRPIELWSNLAQAFTATMAQLKVLLEHLASAPSTLGGGREPRRQGLSPLLPFSCNQVEPETDFDGGLNNWSSRALLVLVRGEYADHVPGFWSRLRAKNLIDGCARQGGNLLEERPMQSWPFKLQGSDKALADAVRFSLADAITGDRLGLPDPAALGEALKNLHGVLPIQLAAPGGAERLKQTLRMMLDFIEAAPPDAPLHRLVVAVLVEDKTLVDAADLVAMLGIADTTRTHIVAPSRLEQLTPDDVRQWFEANTLEGHCTVDREALVAQVFAGTENLRMRSFNNQVRGLLGL